MRLRWTSPAAQDLYRITRYIQRDNPTAARKVAKTIYDGCTSLADMPQRGRKGKVEGIRELVFPGLPYLAVYEIEHDTVNILRIWHGAQKR